jgi:hypothetical protein
MVDTDQLPAQGAGDLRALLADHAAAQPAGPPNFLWRVEGEAVGAEVKDRLLLCDMPLSGHP